MTILTINQTNGVQIIVIVRLKPVWAFAICLEMTCSSGPCVEIALIRAAYCGTNQINKSVPERLKIEWAMAVRLASLLPPIEANNAVIVVPILSPKRTGMAPVKPSKLWPFGPACIAKFCKTAIVAEED